MVKCKSCNRDYALEATHYGHPLNEEGEIIEGLDNWPLCDSHVMYGVIAGWKPTPIQEPTNTEETV